MGYGVTPEEVSRVPAQRRGATPSVRALLSDSRAAGFAITLVIVVTYLPVLIFQYARTDDYMFLALAKHLGLPAPPYAESLIEFSAAEGRPIHGLLESAAFSAAGTIDNLRFVRILSVAGI